MSRCDRPEQAKGDLCVVAAGREAAVSGGYLKNSAARIPAVPEALGFAPFRQGTMPAMLACGYDELGLVYALLELADQVRSSPDPVATLAAAKPLAEQPANRIRSLTRLFCCDVEDKAWYNDREMWPPYLTMMAEQRFNSGVSSCTCVGKDKYSINHPKHFSIVLYIRTCGKTYVHPRMKGWGRPL